MTRCEVFYKRVKQLLDAEDFEGLEAYCQKQARQTLFRIRRYVEFCEEHTLPIGNLSECALRPLIEDPSRDPDTTLKVVEQLRPMLLKPQSEKKPPRITSETVRKILSNVRGQPYLTSLERKQIGGEARLKEVEAACSEFLALDVGERAALLRDLRRVVDLLGTWGAHVGPALRAKVDVVRREVDALRNELLLFLPGERNE